MCKDFVVKWDRHVNTGNLLGAILLIEALPQIDMLADETRLYTPLHLAARDGVTEVLEVLLDRGANVRVKSDILQTPLHLAARYGHLDCIKLLLDKNPKMDVTDKHGQTPMFLAHIHGHKTCAKLISDRGGTHGFHEVYAC